MTVSVDHKIITTYLVYNQKGLLVMETPNFKEARTKYSQEKNSGGAKLDKKTTTTTVVVDVTTRFNGRK